MKKNIFVPVMLIFLIFGGTMNAQNTKLYNNYDFIPGEKILFEDNFLDSQVGEFPPRWDLLAGQPVVNKADDLPFLVFGECGIGNPCKVEPAMKVKPYLGSSFTVEFDFFVAAADENCLMLYFVDNNEDDSRHINFGYDGVISNPYFDVNLQGTYPEAESNWPDKWHHAAVAYKTGQMKVYVDQYRVLVIPKAGFEPLRLYLGGCTGVRITNVRLAEGGGMNMLGKILTDGKFVSHAVQFDVNKSVIRGESMGFLNEMARWLKENPSVKLEVGGYTDGDGDDASNLKLSQARAEAVKMQLVTLGVDASRLTAKGYGETKPVGSNSTPEGKAENRRVEFVKI